MHCPQQIAIVPPLRHGPARKPYREGPGTREALPWRQGNAQRQMAGRGGPRRFGDRLRGDQRLSDDVLRRIPERLRLFQRLLCPADLLPAATGLLPAGAGGDADPLRAGPGGAARAAAAPARQRPRRHSRPLRSGQERRRHPRPLSAPDQSAVGAASRAPCRRSWPRRRGCRSRSSGRPADRGRAGGCARACPCRPARR